jgi:molybdopterin converting factor small subunit
MEIKVKLFAHFRDGRFKEAVRQVPPGTECRQIILELGLRLGEMGIVMVNNQHAPVDHCLQDQDTLALFPLVGGG